MKTKYFLLITILQVNTLLIKEELNVHASSQTVRIKKKESHKFNKQQQLHDNMFSFISFYNYRNDL